MTPETIAELRRLLDNATARPWEADGSQVWGPDGVLVAAVREHSTIVDRPDATLLAAAVNALPALLDAAAERNALAASSSPDLRTKRPDESDLRCGLGSSITLDQAEDAAQAWESGEWEPTDVDGWQLSLQHDAADELDIPAEFQPVKDSESPYAGADHLTGAELAARRHLIGVTLDELATILHVNPRTLRAWESGRDNIPARITDEMGALIDDHTELVQQMLNSERIIRIDRDKTVNTPRPRGWYVAAAARAIADQQDMMVDWS